MESTKVLVLKLKKKITTYWRKEDFGNVLQYGLEGVWWLRPWFPVLIEVHKLHIKPGEMINRSHFSCYYVPRYMYTCVSHAVSEAQVLASQIQDSSCSPKICGAQVLLLSTILSFLKILKNICCSSSEFISTQSRRQPWAWTIVSAKNLSVMIMSDQTERVFNIAIASLGTMVPQYATIFLVWLIPFLFFIQYTCQVITYSYFLLLSGCCKP